MNVLFDHQIFTVQAYGGASRYFVSLSRALRKYGYPLRNLRPAHANEYIKRGNARTRFTFRLRAPRRGLKSRVHMMPRFFGASPGCASPTSFTKRILFSMVVVAQEYQSWQLASI